MLRSKIIILMLVAFVISIFAATALAVPPGKENVYTASKQGVVTFSGKVHADKGKKCPDCHPKLFQMKFGTAKIKFPDHMAGKKFCFACHNGTTSFHPMKPKPNCNRCHKKP